VFFDPVGPGRGGALQAKPAQEVRCDEDGWFWAGHLLFKHPVQVAV
jgi:hypothetical protein